MITEGSPALFSIRVDVAKRIVGCVCVLVPGEGLYASCRVSRIEAQKPPQLRVVVPRMHVIEVVGGAGSASEIALVAGEAQGFGSRRGRACLLAEGVVVEPLLGIAGGVGKQARAAQVIGVRVADDRACRHRG